jgi:hypothetical protein
MTMSDLSSQLLQIANQFLDSVIEAMKSAPLSELVERASGSANGAAPARRSQARSPKALAVAAPSKAVVKTGRRKRASADEVQKLKDIALAAAKGLKPGFSKRDVMKKSGSKVNLGRALSLLVAEGKLSKKGDRRLTQYTVK